MTSTSTTTSQTETTSKSIPSSTRSRQVGVINGPISAVWDQIKACDFTWQKSIVESCETANDEKLEDMLVGATRKINYTDKTKQTIQITEISEKSKRVCWTLISSDPAIEYTSREDSIKLTEITYPDPNKQCVIEWTSDFSNDASISVVLDSDLKKKDAFADLSNAVKN